MLRDPSVCRGGRGHTALAVSARHCALGHVVGGELVATEAAVAGPHPRAVLPGHAAEHHVRPSGRGWVASRGHGQGSGGGRGAGQPEDRRGSVSDKSTHAPFRPLLQQGSVAQRACRADFAQWEGVSCGWPPPSPGNERSPTTKRGMRHPTNREQCSNTHEPMHSWAGPGMWVRAVREESRAVRRPPPSALLTGAGRRHVAHCAVSAPVYLSRWTVLGAFGLP